MAQIFAGYGREDVGMIMVIEAVEPGVFSGSSEGRESNRIGDRGLLGMGERMGRRLTSKLG